MEQADQGDVAEGVAVDCGEQEGLSEGRTFELRLE